MVNDELHKCLITNQLQTIEIWFIFTQLHVSTKINEKTLAMKNLNKFIALVLILTYSLNLSAQQDGWIELINGKDLTDWKASENESTWSVVDGTYQAVGKRSHLFYTGKHLKEGFKNFEIDVWVKTFKLANSGIYIHTQYQPSGWPSNGMEIQVNNIAVTHAVGSFNGATSFRTWK